MTAIITDVKYRMALSLIRDLGEAGVDIIACHGGEGRPFAFASKHVKRAVTLPDPKLEPEGYLTGLRELCAEAAAAGTRPALLPVGAATLYLLTRPENRSAFEPLCGLCIPEAEALDTANDKARLAALASSIGVPVPKSYAISGNGEPGPLPYPVVIKPVFGEKQGLHAEDRYVIARSPEEAKRAVDSFSFGGEPPVIQEYLSGGGYGCSVLAKDGEIINSICHKRLREYPLSGGPSTCCVTVKSEKMLKHANALIKALSFTGIAMVEFKLDSKGEPKLLEINPRIWGTFPLTRTAGSSFAYDWYAISAGIEPKKTPPKEGSRMYYLPSDLRRSIASARRGRLTLSPLGDILSPASKEGIFELSDLRASAAYLSSYMKRGRQ